MRIYEDTTSRAAWHYCFGCKHAGDMVDLAAAVWQMSHQATIKKLSRLGTPLPLELTDKYLAAHERRTRLAGMWDRAKEYLAASRSQALHGLRHRMGFNATCGPERWRSGPGMLLGGMHFKDVFATLFPDSLNEAGFAGYLFKGPRWGEVLLTPYYSHHDRISGFAFCGRKGTEKGDRVFHFSFNGGKGKYDAGLAGMWTVEASRAMFAQFYVALDDPWLMMRLQLRQFATSAVPLPLVVWHDDGVHITKKTWDYLNGRVPVFWVRDEILNASTLHQAIISDGYISFARMENPGKNEGHYLRNNEPREVVRKMLKRAKPWRDALAAWAEEAPYGPVEELLCQLADYGHDMQQIAAISPKFGTMLRLPVPDKAVRVDHRGTVIEKDGRWWHKSPKGCELLMDGMLRVDGTTIKPVHNGQNVESVYYKGRLIYDGKEIPFEISQHAARFHATERIRELSVKATGKMIYIAPRFRGVLIEAANAFSRPQE